MGLRRIVRITALAVMAMPAIAQQQVQPVAPSKVQVAKILTAVKASAAAQVQLQTDQWAAQQANADVLTSVADAQKQLGLDATWNFNFQTGQFVKQPAPPAPPPPPPPAVVPKALDSPPDPKAAQPAAAKK